MRRMGWLISLLVVLSFPGFAQCVSAQSPPMKRHVVVPQSSVVPPGNAGDFANTDLLLSVADSSPFAIDVHSESNGLPPVPGLFFETPASVACVYRLIQNPRPGCNPDRDIAFGNCGVNISNFASSGWDFSPA